MAKFNNFIKQIQEAEKKYGKANHIYISFEETPYWRIKLGEEDIDKIEKFLIICNNKIIIITEDNYYESINNIDDLKAYEGYKLLI